MCITADGRSAAPGAASDDRRADVLQVFDLRNKLAAARVDVGAPISALLVAGDSVAALTTDGRLIILRVSPDSLVLGLGSRSQGHHPCAIALSRYSNIGGVSECIFRVSSHQNVPLSPMFLRPGHQTGPRPVQGALCVSQTWRRPS